MTKPRIDSILTLLARIAAAVCVCVVSSCSSGSSTVDEPDTRPMHTPTPVPCTEGKACECMPGQSGMVSCASGFASCECAACPPLEVHDPAKTNACGGAPFGVWRLTKLELGRSQLSLTVAGESRGNCDVMLDTPDETPLLLMNLKDGGAAEYYAKSVATKTHWSNSCITSQVSQFSCGSSAWTGVSNCALSCDICTCDTTLGETSDDDARWSRSATTLTVAPFGSSGEFDYCVQGSKLALSHTGLSLEFEQVFTIDTPKACEKRAAAECTLGQGCSLGVCKGSDSCARIDFEDDCLTHQGCTWNATACTGLTPSCTLADFGSAPGCDLVDQPVSCVGTPAACTTLDVDTCASRPGCKVNDRGRCNGPSFSCQDFIDCPGGAFCIPTYPGCIGEFSCANFNLDYECNDTNENIHNTPCKWEPSWCEGDAKPCSEYSQTVCGDMPGCQLSTQ
jgi:hypothetical protein